MGDDPEFASPNPSGPMVDRKRPTDVSRDVAAVCKPNKRRKYVPRSPHLLDIAPRRCSEARRREEDQEHEGEDGRAAGSEFERNEEQRGREGTPTDERAIGMPDALARPDADDEEWRRLADAERVTRARADEIRARRSELAPTWSPLTALPDELRLRIFERVDARDAGALARTCSSIRAVVGGDEGLWRGFYRSLCEREEGHEDGGEEGEEGKGERDAVALLHDPFWESRLEGDDFAGPFWRWLTRARFVRAYSTPGWCGIGRSACGTAVYMGEWEDGRPHGRGIRVDRSLSCIFPGTYVGRFVAGLRCGTGTWKNAAGDTYVGLWRDDLKNGYGEAVSPEGLRRYAGDWHAGAEHGMGAEAWFEGDRYDGEWKSGLKHGRGVYTWAAGDRYDGRWEAGDMHGRGVYHQANGGMWCGRFSRDQLEGLGAGLAVSASNRMAERLVGEYREDKLNGVGVRVRNDGAFFFGTWEDGLKHGPGIFMGSDGRVCEAIWRKGCKQGRVVRTAPDGSRVWAWFEFGKREGDWVRW